MPATAHGDDWRRRGSGGPRSAPQDDGGWRCRQPPLSTASNLAGRRGSPRRAVSRAAAEPGALMRSSGVRQQPRPPPVSPLAPRPGPKPWRFAAWQIRKLAFPLPGLAVPPPKRRFGKSRDPRPKPRFRPAVHGPKSWVLPLRSSRAEARSCPTDPKAEAPVPPVAARRPEGPAFAGRVLDRSPVSRLSASPARRPMKPVGAYEACRFRFR